MMFRIPAAAVAVFLILAFPAWDVRAVPSGTIEINAGQAFTPDRVVYINASLVDIYPITQAQLSEDPGFMDASWVAMRKPLPFQLSAGDGMKMVYAQFRNSQGEESEVLTDDICLDTSPPSGTVSVNAGAEFTNDPQSVLAFSATDASQVKEVMVSNKADFQGAQWVTYKGELAWGLLPGNGARTVFVKFRDAFLHESPAVNDTILLDTIAPSLLLSINSGSRYTAKAGVTLRLDVTENYRTESMIVTQYDSCDGLPWRAFSETVPFDLSGGEGNNTVRATVRDAAGNEGPTVHASVILDTVPPATTIGEIPAEVDTTSFQVNWSGADFTSGIASFDIQVRDGTGPWADWYTNNSRTSATFTGTPDHRYSFRGRAQDRAGNQGRYPELASGSVYIWPRYDPVVAFTAPRQNATVSGKVTVAGTASHPDHRRSVQKVTLWVDDGPPVTVTGTAQWRYRLDTTRLREGEHTLTIQSSDGERLSNETVLRIMVSNPGPAAIDDRLVAFAAVAIAAVAAGAGYFVLLRRKRAAPVYQPPPEPPAEDISLRLTPEAAAVTELSPEAKARIAAMIAQPAEVREKTDAEKRVAEMAARESRILTALSSLPRGLPPSLWGIEMEDLAARVVKAEREDTPDGEMLIKINNKWYYGDESNLGMFMQEYKDR